MLILLALLHPPMVMCTSPNISAADLRRDSFFLHMAVVPVIQLLPLPHLLDPSQIQFSISIGILIYPKTTVINQNQENRKNLKSFLEIDLVQIFNKNQRHLQKTTLPFPPARQYHRIYHRHLYISYLRLNYNLLRHRVRRLEKHIQRRSRAHTTNEFIEGLELESLATMPSTSPSRSIPPLPSLSPNKLSPEKSLSQSRMLLMLLLVVAMKASGSSGEGELPRRNSLGEDSCQDCSSAGWVGREIWGWLESLLVLM